MWHLFKKNRRLVFFIWVLVFLIAESLSWLSFNFVTLNILFLLLIAGLAVALTIKRPEYALYLSLAELFWGSVGHSFEYGFFNTRLVVFVAIIFTWLLMNLFKLNRLKIRNDKRVGQLWVLLIILVIFSTIVAYFKGNSLVFIFLDANAYVYLLYLPFWYQVYEKKYLANIAALLQAAALVTAGKTLDVFHIYAQNYDGIHLRSIYEWIRDSRSGEITPFADNFWRVSMKSQIYVLFAWLFTYVRHLRIGFSRWNYLYLAILGSSLIISLSRSLWLGGAIAMLILAVYFIKQNRKMLVPYLKSILIILVASVLLVEFSYNIPKYQTFNIFSQRSSDIGEPAVSSRMQLLGPMLESIKASPLIGHGFGKTLTYNSSDPRIKTLTNPSGRYTTFAFEWGWLDQWLKGGLLLVACLAAWVLLVYRRAISYRREDYILSWAVILVLTALISIHEFSPFLNHPLGLGALMIMTVVISKNEKKNKSYN